MFQDLVEFEYLQSNAPAMTTWGFDATTQAQLNQHTHMIYYSSQLIEMDQQLGEFNKYSRHFNR